MNQNKNYLGAGLLALAAIVLWGWVLPEYDKASELNLALEERQILYESRSTTIKNIQDLNKQYQERSADITRISSILPSKKNLAEAVSAVDRLAIQSGLQLVSAHIVGKEGDVNNYNYLPIEISMVGGYPGLVSFLQSAEKNLRIIDITSVDAATSSTDRPGSLNITVKGNAYYLK